MTTRRRCVAAALPGTFSGARCALTATAGSDLCWQHTPRLVAGCGHPTPWAAWQTVHGAPDLCEDCARAELENTAPVTDPTRLEFTHQEEDP